MKSKSFPETITLSGKVVPLTLRKSARAKKTVVRLVPGIGVELVLARGTRLAEAMKFMESRRTWLENAARTLTDQGYDITGEIPSVPDNIFLKAVGADIPVTMVTGSGRARLTENAGRILLSGGDSKNDRKAMLVLLREYVRSKAKTLLPPMLRGMSRDTGLHFDEIHIRCQKTRWGSCSVRPDRVSVNLNAALLFLSPSLCAQVMLHELCHSRHTNHSQEFWAFVEAFNPDASILERELTHGRHLLPSWWEAAGRK